MSTSDALRLVTSPDEYDRFTALRRIWSNTAIAWIICLIILGLIAANTTVAGGQIGEWLLFGRLILTALASYAIGFLFGMLVGVPMTSSRGDAANGGKPDALYRPNDQLQQISEWLVKLLLGAGLTQLGNISSIGTFLAPFVGSPVIALVTTALFSVIGFLSGYMTTILYFGPLIKKEGLDIYGAIDQKIDEKMEEKMEEVAFLATTEGITHQSLYQDAPGGFENAIRRARKFFRESKSGSADIHGNFACALAQQYRYELEQKQKDPNSADMRKILEEAVKNARKAVSLDSEWKGVFRNLYYAAPGSVDDDWAIFEKKGNDPDGTVRKFFEEP